MGKDKVAVYIFKDLYSELERRVKTSEGKFKTVEDYANFSLRKILNQDENKEVVLKAEEKEKIKSRLKRLGYL